ncbi:MAG TPA: hypothetical protein PLI57_05755 [Spirochaetota bacterium]|nr:hypothetical protein [Spirochaetota bacterium]
MCHFPKNRRAPICVEFVCANCREYVAPYVSFSLGERRVPYVSISKKPDERK